MYDYKSFWIKQGIMDNPIMNEAHAKQEEVLLRKLKKLEFDSVLEFGAGWGRMTKLIKDNFNPRFYTAVDLSKERLKQIDGVNTVVGDVLKDNHFMKADLVIACEMCLHIPPENIKTAIDNMKKLTNKYLITIDYYPVKHNIVLSKHCFLHEYPILYGSGVNGIRVDDHVALFVWEK